MDLSIHFHLSRNFISIFFSGTAENGQHHEKSKGEFKNSPVLLDSRADYKRVRGRKLHSTKRSVGDDVVDDISSMF